MSNFDHRSTPRGASLPGQVAANDDDATGAVAGSPRATPYPGTAGWDPFEIWRTRVRDARRDARRSGTR